MTKATASNRLMDLESVHRDLDQQVQLLSRRAYLTPAEQLRVVELKKRKLSMKDRIMALRAAEPA